ncbi:hypothetical protein [Rhodococcus jostii]|uniref:hypothetical protein n=1 Tax=Rhodococcus jostii TaxID=132919 RepID=UPI00115FD5F4|nr:hypothetical protein [Rhodococcus jostii]
MTIAATRCTWLGARQYLLLREKEGMAWIGRYRPDREEIGSAAREFTLHHLAVEEPVASSGAEIGCSDHELAPAQLVDLGSVCVRIGDGFRALARSSWSRATARGAVRWSS